MLAAGVQRAYGIIGTSNLYFFDALYDVRDKIRYISCRHEQVAATMAEVEGRLTGKPGVVILHSGPGALNSLISLANAAKDCSPALAITGAVKRRMRGTDGMHEVDHLKIFAPICRAVFRVESAASIPETFRAAYRATYGPPPGPVLVEVPEDVWREIVDAEPAIEPPSIPKYPGPSEDDVKYVLEAIEKSQKPLLLAGAGIQYAGASELALRFAERWNVPVATTGNGRCTLPESHPLCLGRCGMAGTSAGDSALENADLILTVGGGISDILSYDYSFPIKAAVITVNLDSGRLMPRLDVRKTIHSDAKRFLEKALHLSGSSQPPDRSAWWASFDEPKKAWMQMVEGGAMPRKPLPSGYVCREIANHIGPKDILALGTGMHVLYPLAHIQRQEPLTSLSAVNFGAMGFATAAGMAAKLIYPERQVVTISGDGDVLMTIQDLETIVRENINLKIFVLNDNAYRVLLFRQKFQTGGRILGTEHSNPDFARLAESFGIKGIRLENPEDVAPGIRAAMESPGPVVVDAIVDRDEPAPANLMAVATMIQD
jgi:acetolactate synthase-1/2/3 large subunit